MKYIINIVILINTILLFSQNTKAQKVVFEYDAAGNMAQRSLDCVANPPGVPTVLNVFNNSALLSWQDVPDITGSQFKKEGEQWQYINTAQSTAILSNLSSCQKYLVRLQYTCAGETKYSPEISFTTKGCTNCSAEDITLFAIPNANSMTVNWDVYPEALYILNYRKAGENNFATYTTAIPFVFLPVLESCTTYEFAMQIVCSGGAISARGNTFSFNTGGCRLGLGEENVLLQVSPNPASKHINIQIKNEVEVQQLQIYNSSGQLVKHLQPQVGKTSYQVVVNDFATGVYLIKVYVGDEVMTTKFSVQQF